MEHRRVCFCMLSLLPLVQISELSQANSLLFGKVCCRTPRGVRGLKSVNINQVVQSSGRTPRGVRGLKFSTLFEKIAVITSHPSRGAWIEISAGPDNPALSHTSHPSRGAWIEIILVPMLKNQEESHPSRGAWIEIVTAATINQLRMVAPLAGCVD